MGIVDRITAKTDLKLAQIERTLGFGNGTIRKWDISFPSIDKVVAVADLINVTVDYLAGREEIKSKETSFTYAAHNELAHDLSPEQIEQLKTYAEFLRQQK